MIWVLLTNAFVNNDIFISIYYSVTDFLNGNLLTYTVYLD